MAKARKRKTSEILLKNINDMKRKDKAYFKEELEEDEDTRTWEEQIRDNIINYVSGFGDSPGNAAVGDQELHSLMKDINGVVEKEQKDIYNLSDELKLWNIIGTIEKLCSNYYNEHHKLLEKIDLLLIIAYQFVRDKREDAPTKERIKILNKTIAQLDDIDGLYHLYKKR